MEKLSTATNENGSVRALPRVESAKLFIESWHVYRTVLENNDLAHITTIDRIAADIEKDGPRKIRLLDLGCGDGAIVSAVFDKLSAEGSATCKLERYTGVDASRAALDLNTVKAGERELVEAELEAYLATTSSASSPSYDIILANLILHHFEDPEAKRHLIRQITALLPDGGRLYYGDVYANEGEDRDDMLRRWKPRMDEYRGLTLDERASVWEHVSEKDYPSTQAFMREIMVDGGLNVEVLADDGFYVCCLKGTKV